MNVPPLPRPTGGRFFEVYTRGLTTADLERLFTRDAPEAYRFFSRNIDFGELKDQPWHWRILGHSRLLFLAFTLKLTPARRVLYGASLVACVVGLVEFFQTVHLFLVPHPTFAPGTIWLLTGFLLVNLLMLLEVADRLSLKNHLEIAGEVQLAMLPPGQHGRRRLLRHPAARRWTTPAGARRCRGQGQPGGAAHRALDRDAAHAR